MPTPPPQALDCSFRGTCTLRPAVAVERSGIGRAAREVREVWSSPAMFGLLQGVYTPGPTIKRVNSVHLTCAIPSVETSNQFLCPYLRNQGIVRLCSYFGGWVSVYIISLKPMNYEKLKKPIPVLIPSPVRTVHLCPLHCRIPLSWGQDFLWHFTLSLIKMTFPLFNLSPKKTMVWTPLVMSKRSMTNIYSTFRTVT